MSWMTVSECDLWAYTSLYSNHEFIFCLLSSVTSDDIYGSHTSHWMCELLSLVRNEQTPTEN